MQSSIILHWLSYWCAWEHGEYRGGAGAGAGAGAAEGSGAEEGVYVD